MTFYDIKSFLTFRWHHFIKPRSLKDIIKEELYDAQRNLLLDERNLEYSQQMVKFREFQIARLAKRLETLNDRIF